MLKKIKLLNYSRYIEKSGSLIPFYTDKSFPKSFKLKRFFLLYGKKKFIRADHAHMKTTQIIIPLRGNIKITTFYKNKKKIFSLKVSKKKALYIPPYHWIKIDFKSDEDSLITLCDYKYDKKEYISNFNSFQNLSKK